MEAEKKNPKIFLYILLAVLGLYALVMTVYTVYTHNTSIAPITELKPSNTPAIPSDTAPAEIEEKQPSEINDSSKDNNAEDALTKIVGSVIPSDDLKTFKVGYKTFKEAVNPRELVLSTVSGLLVSLVSVAIVAGFCYLSYRSTAAQSPLLDRPLIMTIQNHVRLVAFISAGCLLVSSLVVFFDAGKRAMGAAHVSAVFFAVLACLCAFTLTFLELSLSAQTLSLPTLSEGLLSGKSAQTLMTWGMTFLTINMQTLGAGLLVMWVTSFIVKWVVKQAEGTAVHRFCSALALPLTLTYMSAKRSGSIFQMIIRVALTLLSIALTIDLLAPT